LFRIMLALLLSLCVAAAVVIIFHINDDGSMNNARLGGVNGEQDAADESVLEAPANIRSDLQRAIVKPEGSDYWHFYPIIPSGKEPGDIVILTVTADGFMGWEIDDSFMDVELTEEITEDGLLQVSFVMPDGEVSIRALYNDIPYANFEASIRNEEPREYGAPVDLDIPKMIDPPAYVFIPYNTNLDIRGDIFEYDPDEGEFTWSITTPLGQRPSGITFNHAPGYGFNITGNPQNKGTFVIYIEILKDGAFHDTLIYIFEVYDTPAPVIEPSKIPHAMVGVPYTFNINVKDLPVLPAGSSWTWVEPPNMAQHGLTLSGSPPNAVISGTPRAPTTAQETHVSFVIGLRTNHAALNALLGVTTITYNITIYQQPEITALTPKSPGTNVLLDGLVAHPYETAFNNSYMPNDGSSWEWRVQSVTPSGLGLDFVSGANYLKGEPGPVGETAREYTVIVRYTTTNRDRLSNEPGVSIIGYVDEPFTVTIWPRPKILTDGRLPDGMAGPDATQALTEPAEPADWYSEKINAERFPDDTEWVWLFWDGSAFNNQFDGTFSSISTADTLPVPDDLPQGVNFKHVSKEEATIIGSPRHETRGTYTFRVRLAIITSANPNMQNAFVEEIFTIKIWQRHYLHVDILQSGMTGYVVREGAEEGINFFDLTPTQAGRYTPKRAVMPRTQGVISVAMTASAFVWWEVEEGNVHIGGPVGTNGSSRNGYGYRGLEEAYVRITIPGSNDANVTKAQDVYIRGVHPSPSNVPVAQRRLEPRVTWNDAEGRVGDEKYGGLLSIDERDIGFLGKLDENGRPVLDTEGRPIQAQPQVTWEVVKGTGIPPVPAPGLTLSSSHLMAGIRGTPTQAQATPYSFTVGITLPGTMRIDRTFTTLIEPALTLVPGDVDRSGYVDLIDLILLVRYLAGEHDLDICHERADLNGNGRIDSGDLAILARMFAWP
jgi:hypothetical protein